MRKLLYFMCATACTAALLPQTCFAFGETPAIIYDGKEIYLENTDELFPEFKNLMPGDTTEQKVRITAIEEPVTIYLTQNPSDDEIPEDYNHVHMTVSTEDTVISEATLAEMQSAGAEGLELYTFNQPGTKDLLVTISVDEEAGNGLMDAKAVANWTFTAQDLTEDQEPEAPKPEDQEEASDETSGDHDDSTDRKETIASEDIDDSNVGKSDDFKVTKTGDETRIYLYIIGGCIGAVGIIAAAVIRRNNH